ncbi:MAG: hypothetical protein JJU48_09910 [Methylophaga sp.]|nr:hypothetical protein [Methylophaga sp.]
MQNFTVLLLALMMSTPSIARDKFDVARGVGMPDAAFIDIQMPDVYHDCNTIKLRFKPDFTQMDLESGI